MEFWDLIVVTAVDESQRDAYELQITEKVGIKSYSLEFKVFSNAPGSKIGKWASQPILLFISYSLHC